MKNQNGVLDTYHFSEALQPSAKKIGMRCGAAAVSLLATRLMEVIGSPEEDKFSYIHRSAIEEHEQDSYKENFKNKLIDVLRDTAVGAFSGKPGEGISGLRLLLQSNYPTLVRIGIYVVSECYSDSADFFWQNMRTEWYEKVNYWHEIFWLIKKNFQRFTIAHRAKYLEVVKNFQGDWGDDARQSEWDELHRRDLLFPATALGDQEVDELFSKLTEKLGPVREHPDFHSYSTRGVWSADRSPVSSDSLQLMSADELLEFLRNFEPDTKSGDGATYRGLASSLTAAVRESDDGFSGRLKLFKDMPPPYQHGLLRGLKERWSDDKREIDWAETIDLVTHIIEPKALLSALAEKSQDAWEPSIYWVLHDVADLFRAAAESSRPVTPQLLKDGLGILTKILEVLPIEASEEPNDVVSHAINSTRGRLLESIINIALAVRRSVDASGEKASEIWALVEPTFNRELSTSEFGSNPDFSALAGMYCVNFHFLSKSWTEDNFHRIFSEKSDVAWRCAVEGFSYQRYLHDWLFEKLISGGHLKRIIFSEEVSESAKEKALQFLALAYLEGMETLDDASLLGEVVRNLNVFNISQISWFFWTLRSKKSHAESILHFWAVVVDSIEKNGTEQAEIYSALNLLAPFLEELSAETTRLWYVIAPYAQVRHHGYILIKNLARLSSKYPKQVAEVFLSALNRFLPEYEKEDIEKCVLSIAQAGEFDAAEEICIEYAKQESNLLREISASIRDLRRTEAM